VNPSSAAEPQVATRRKSPIWRYLLALLTLEIGLFLIIFPWTDWWLFNHIQDSNSWLGERWEDPYFQGAISGLGAVNVYLAVVEFISTLRRREQQK
jgi:hypothetical protein